MRWISLAAVLLGLGIANAQAEPTVMTDKELDNVVAGETSIGPKQGNISSGENHGHLVPVDLFPILDSALGGLCGTDPDRCKLPRHNQGVSDVIRVQFRAQ